MRVSARVCACVCVSVCIMCACVCVCVGDCLVWELPTHARAQDLSHNRLAALPPSFASLVALRKLNLSANVLQALPDLGRMTRLAELDLHGNELAELPAGVGQLAHVGRLDLRHNSLRTVPGLQGMAALRELYLGNNALVALDAGTLPAGLHMLDARDNHIARIDEVGGP
jgi:Leucine-rich repeat (LRR) protein